MCCWISFTRARSALASYTASRQVPPAVYVTQQQACRDQPEDFSYIECYIECWQVYGQQFCDCTSTSLTTIWHVYGSVYHLHSNAGHCHSQVCAMLLHGSESAACRCMPNISKVRACASPCIACVCTHSGRTQNTQHTQLLLCATTDR